MTSRLAVCPPRGRIYALADGDTLGEAALPDAVEAMAQAGVEWIQVRAKSTSGGRLFRLLEDIQHRLAGSPVRLWINDRVDLAALFASPGIAGIHLGQDDLPVAAARKVLGQAGSGDLWLGRSTHNEAQVSAAVADPEVDVVAVGPVFPTTGKTRPDPVVGLALVRTARRGLDGSSHPRRPLVAIGGIDADNLARVLEAGADAVAILGAACRGDIRNSCRRLLEAAA